MPLPGVCPSCGATFDLPHALADADARQALRAALEIDTAIAPLVVRYIALHAPSGKRLAWPKLTRLLVELAALVRSGEVTRGRETRAAPLESWHGGLSAVLESADAGTLELPLKGHGLLCEIVHRRSAKRAAAQAAADRPLHPSHRRAGDGHVEATRSSDGMRRIAEITAALGKTQRPPDE